ncbi:MAG: hypothetical protein Q4E62_10115, partial [Sutterellaceae bacterium]|nr:hypothetical protein [Sutterellaceae bacterium]
NLRNVTFTTDLGMQKMTPTAFIKGLRDGLTAPFTAFNPAPVRTQIPQCLVEPSYRPQSEDWLHIRSYFDKALVNTRKEISDEKK